MSPRRRILHVEDDDVNRKIVRDLLERDDYELVEAVDGEEALRLAAAGAPDLVLMDIQLPRMNGYEVTRRLRALHALRRVPIIAITSYALAGDEQRARDAGCTDYVTKPYDPAALRALVHQHLAG